MALTKTSFKKGEAKGKPKGAVNKTTKEQRQFLNDILLGRGESIKTALDRLEPQPDKYIDAVAKLLPYVIAKKTDITSDDEPLRNEIILTDKQLSVVINSFIPNED